MQCLALPGSIASRVRESVKDMVAPPNVRMSLAELVRGVLGEEMAALDPSRNTDQRVELVCKLVGV